MSQIPRLPQESSSKKRARSIELQTPGDIPDDPEQHKLAKTHPFFTKKPLNSATEGLFQWHTLSKNSTCLYATNLNPSPSSKVAAFDLDGTLIKSGHGKARGGKPTEWEWWRPLVPKKLLQLHKDDYAIVIISNQNLKPLALKHWKEKIQSFASSLEDLPFCIFAATAKDVCRKPMPGMWWELERLYKGKNVEIDKTRSFFVGDAAGRKDDFAGTDRKWATNVGLNFYTPEEYFLESPKQSFKMEGFESRILLQNQSLSRITPTSSPLLPIKSQVELVLFVGYPCLGKSTFFHNNFKSAGYHHVNQDTLKTRDKCVKMVRQSLQNGCSCVVDNTNRDRKTRGLYINIAKELHVPVRCFEFEGSIELAWHNNLYRTFISVPDNTNEPQRSLVPYSALTGFRDSYEQPELDEGFEEIKQVHWIFEGTPEEQQRWSMWLQIDGK